MTKFTNKVSNFVKKFGIERTFTNTRAIGLDDAIIVFDVLGANASSCQGSTGRGVRRSHIRVISLLQVEVECLGTFNDNIGVVIFKCGENHTPLVFDKGLESISICGKILKIFINKINRCSKTRIRIAVVIPTVQLPNETELSFQFILTLVEQITNAEIYSVCLFGITRTNSTKCGANFFVTFPHLLEFIHFDVVGTNDLRTRRQNQVHGSNLNSSFLQSIDFLTKNFNVDHDAGCNDANIIRFNDGRREQVECKLFTICNNCMTRIVSASGPNAECIIGNIMRHTTFSFVAPLKSYNQSNVTQNEPPCLLCLFLKF